LDLAVTIITVQYVLNWSKKIFILLTY